MAGDDRLFSLTDNPFALLGLTPRASREQIEEAAARGGSRAAAATVLDPHARLAEELSWLPGASSLAAKETVSALGARDAGTAAGRLVLLRGLAKANLAADMALRFADPDMIDQMVRAWDGVESADVLSQVNADRMISGYPPANAAQVDWALQTVRERHGRSAARLLAEAGDGRDRLIRLIERPAPSGHDNDLKLIDAVVGAYTDELAPLLDQREATILNEVDAMTRGGRDGLDRLEGHMAAWEAANRPALVMAKLRGREDPRALGLVGAMRTLYLDPSAGAGRIGPAGRIANMLLGFFPDAPAIQRMASGDVTRLGAIVQGPQAVAERPDLSAVARAAQTERGESKAVRDRRQAAVRSKDAARAAAQAQQAQAHLERQARERAAADWKSKGSVPPTTRAQTRPPAQATAAPVVVGQAAEAAREQLIAAVRARVAAAGQTPPAVPGKKKGGCGWIIPFLIVMFFVIKGMLSSDGEESTTTTPAPEASAPLVAPTPEILPQTAPDQVRDALDAPLVEGDYTEQNRQRPRETDGPPTVTGETGGGGGR
jgi:hypothetical protein